MRTFDVKKFVLTFVGVVIAGVAYDLALHDSVLWSLYISAGLIVGGLAAAFPVKSGADA